MMMILANYFSKGRNFGQKCPFLDILLNTANTAKNLTVYRYWSPNTGGKTGISKTGIGNTKQQQT
jgi:hypothetical protein